MNRRIMKQAIFLAILPLVTMVLTFQVWGSQTAVLTVLLLGTAAQVSAVRFCKLDAHRFTRPTDQLMRQMGTTHVPIPYEPGKYRIDTAVAALAVWLSVPAPLLAFLARIFTREYTISVLNFATYTAPNFHFLVPALFFPLLASLAYCCWVYFDQANVIYSEPGENRRYLLHGFADSLEKQESVNRVLTISYPHLAVFRRG